MNVIKKNKELTPLKRGMNFKNYFNKNKYFFNELYKNKTLPKDEIVSIVKNILETESNDEKDIKIKNIAEEFVKDHHELFLSENQSENVSKNDDKNHVENRDENRVENHVENHDENLVEKLDDIKHEVELIEEIKEENPNYKHIEEFNSKIERLKDDIYKKFEDMIDSHLDLKRTVEEKRNINDHDAKARIENLEGKIEMLYGQQMEEKPKRQPQTKPNTKTDIMNKYISYKLNK